jgi:hypothetical protein
VQQHTREAAQRKARLGLHDGEVVGAVFVDDPAVFRVLTSLTGYIATSQPLRHRRPRCGARSPLESPVRSYNASRVRDANIGFTNAPRVRSCAKPKRTSRRVRFARTSAVAYSTTRPCPSSGDSSGSAAPTRSRHGLDEDRRAVFDQELGELRAELGRSVDALAEMTGIRSPRPVRDDAGATSRGARRPPARKVRRSRSACGPQLRAARRHRCCRSFA